MDWQAWFTVALTVGCLLGMSVFRQPPHLMVFAAMSLLGVTGILTPAETLAGFSNPGLITVAAMFIVAAGLQTTGGVDSLVHRVLGRPASVRAALLRFGAPVIALSGFLNNTPLVAAMIPALSSWARRIDIAPSKLMIPLSYAAILGGTLTMIGTSTNLVINGQYAAMTGAEPFGLFDITAVGLPVALVCALFMWLTFPRLLPDYREQQPFANLREFTLEVQVDPAGPLVGKSIQAAGLRNLRRVFLVEIERQDQTLAVVEPDEILHGGDRLVFAGDTGAISDLLRIRGIIPSTHTGAPDEPILGGRLTEVVVSPYCSLIGERIREANFRGRFNAAVLAVARNGERIGGNLGAHKLQAGDTLLLETHRDFGRTHRDNREFLLVNDLGAERPRHDRAALAWVILITVVALAGTGMMDMLYAALLGAGMMIATGCISLGEAEKSLDLPVILTIAASFALGLALDKTGVAEMVANSVLEMSGGKPWLLLVLCYVLISVLTEIISNTAAAMLTLPIVLQTAAQAGVGPEPFIFAMMMAASASFATPIGYQTNLMVSGPGNYRFTDFLRVGIPMNIVAGAVSCIVLIFGWGLA